MSPPDTLRLWRVRLSPEASPAWFGSGEFVAPLSGLRENKPVENVVAWAAPLEGGAEAALVTESGGRRRALFDLEKTLRLIRKEEYPGAALRDSVVTLLPFDYTRLPMRLIGWAAHLLTRVQDPEKLPPFPRYPLDLSADVLSELAGEKRNIKWPEGKRYAVLFTHDVDTEWLFDSRQGPFWREAFAKAEEECGVRSAWYCVPRSMTSENCRRGLADLARRGHEIGAHGLTHDAALPNEPEADLAEKLRQARDLLSSLAGLKEEIGYRAPWLSRNSNLYRALSRAGFLYDTSPPNSDFQRNNERANNGCATCFPFIREGVVVLPVTLPQDAIRAATGKSPEEFWNWLLEITERIKKAGGMAVVSTHIQPHHSANETMLAGYRKVLKKFASDPEAWRALPAQAARLCK